MCFLPLLKSTILSYHMVTDFVFNFSHFPLAHRWYTSTMGGAIHYCSSNIFIGIYLNYCINFSQFSCFAGYNTPQWMVASTIAVQISLLVRIRLIIEWPHLWTWQITVSLRIPTACWGSVNNGLLDTIHCGDVVRWQICQGGQSHTTPMRKGYIQDS
jgi:hypothetical protein